MAGKQEKYFPTERKICQKRNYKQDSQQVAKGHHDGRGRAGGGPRLAEILQGDRLSLSEARDIARERFGRARGDKAFESIKSAPKKFGLRIKQDPDNYRISYIS